MARKVQFRRGTSAEWTSSNPILLSGEMGLETDTRKFKIGNGTTIWTSLSYATQGEAGITVSVNNVVHVNGNITLTPLDIGLGNVDNTSDDDKNVLSATKLTTPRTINGVNFDGTANITVADSTKEPTFSKNTAFNKNYTVTATDIKMDGIQSLGSLDTLAKADHVHPSDTSRVPTSRTVNSKALTSNITLDKSDVGLGNVDNTSDVNKPVSSATQTALNGKEPTITGDTVAKFWSGIKTWRDLATDVRAVLLTGLSTATSTVVTATDSILVAIGKLQAQVSLKINTSAIANNLTETVAGKVLDATQGKVLKDMIDTVSTQMNDVLGVKFALASSSPTGTRTNSAVGLTVTPGTGTKGTSGFDKFPVFNLRTCNRVNGVVTAYEGEPGFSRTTADVFVEIPKGYYYRYVDATYEYFMISDKPFPNSKLHKLFNKGGKIQDFAYIGAYKSSYDGTSKHESKSEKLPDINVSRTTSRTRSKARGAYAILQDIHTRDWLNMLMMVELANKNMQTAIGSGYSSMAYSASHVAVITEPTINRVVLANAFADLFVVGQQCSIGTALGSTNVASSRAITAIDVYDAGNKAITFDGAAVNIAAGNIIWSSQQKTGNSDTVGNGTGRAAGVDGKCSIRYRGIEDLYGNVWEWVDNLNIKDRQGYSDPNGRIELYNDTDFGVNYMAHKALFPATDNYVVRMMFDENIGVACMPESVGGGSTQYYCDYYYQSVGERAAFVGGGLSGGLGVGPFCWVLIRAASGTDWALSARLLEIPV